MRPPLNLATRPVRNERLPGLLFAAASLILLLTAVQHAFLVRRLLPSRSAALKAEVAQLQAELGSLTQRLGHSEDPVSPAQKAEWLIVKELVDRRTFWWSELFTSLEQTIPPDVRVVAVTPHVSENDYWVDLTARVATIEAGLEFVQVLEERPEFEGVFPRGYNPVEETIVEYSYGMRFLTAASRAAATGGSR